MSSSPYSSPEISSATQTDSSQVRFSTMYDTQEDVLEDLSSRFILNLPDEELNSIERISFQVEQAHWYYEDFVREANPKLPSLPLKKFSAMLFAACPLLHRWEDHEQAFTDFMQYKTRVPVCGAIMLNETWEKCVLVKGWKSSSGWGFPKGKINEDEPRANCATREVLEETGYNLAGRLNPDHVIEMSIKEQKISLFIVPGVPEDFPFKTKTRKEISKIEWFRLADLPTWRRNKAAPGKFYLITPFIGALKQFIREHKPTAIPRKPPRSKRTNHAESGSSGQHRRSPADSPSNSSQEANQESSSQSSSADNGDPQTPSPQAPSTLANHVNIAAEGMTTELDPHFARLLSGLTLSGTASAQDGVVKSLGSQVTPASVNDPASPPAPLMSTPMTATPPIPADQLSKSVRQPSRDHLENAALPVNPSLSSNAMIIPRTSSQLNSTSPVKPHRQPTSRRTPSTADISPYLSKSAEIPSSAKHLKQIALLETVATESAQMSPMLHMRDAAFNSALQGHPARYMDSPPPMFATTIPSTSAGHLGASGTRLPPLNHPGPSMHDDPFVVRPRTSQAVHRVPYPALPNPPGRMSMTHNQALALMNNHPYTSQMPSQPPHYRFLPAPHPEYTPFATTSSRGADLFPQPPFAVHRHISVAPPHPTGSVPPLPIQVPMSVPALSPMFSIASQGPSGMVGNPLLSILNGNGNPLTGTIFRGPV
ncbi:hypothetical protein D9757_002949 [Collybiopsis confluens]|uniref:Nudix hydrolase domain-containing protein n=1 Tax=Collybiopsis confluens TaxID=2823264 RepID=A0A8H5HVZ2_9AGAR|nr:hypothetical protein D9757_002949 [Collybiopsis confluens]